ncbi:MAG: response regulator [Treponema sp.]|jgi:signal transduction histidine kinase/CheY-like chemotaxis protein|nr:response regulator [Treponema sp.]
MRLLIKRFWRFIAHAQLLAVFFAFAVMVFLSYRFMGDLERRHLIRDVDSSIANTQAYITADLMEPETFLGGIAETIRVMIMDGESFEKVWMYLTSITKYITTDDRLMSYATGAYGVFDAFDGKFATGIDWIPPDDYVPQSRPWYTAAVEAGGNIGVTEPYLDVSLGVVALTFARRIFDDNGNPLGVVCLDIMLDRIRGYAINTNISENGYGILLDKNFNVIAHPHPAYLGRNLRQMNDGPAIEDELRQGRNINERKATDYRGDPSILFIRRLDNGWYMAILTYAKEYYQSVTLIARILTFLGAMLAAALSAILLRMISARNKAEERTQLMLDATPISANFWDRNFNNIDCNQEAVKLFGLSGKKEYIDRFHELSPEYQPDGRLSREKAADFIKEAYEEGSSSFEWVHRKLNGEFIPCEITLVRVKYRDDFIVLGYTRDLRELRAKEAKVREVSERVQIMFNASPLASCFIDKDMEIIDCNMKMLELFKLPNKQEFFNRYLGLLPEYQPNGKPSKMMYESYVHEAFEDGYSHGEWMYRNADGEELPVEMTMVRVKYEGENALALYIRDLREFKAMIREMRKAEIAEESNKAKTNFLAKMSHEIRTPMNAILGITEIQLQNASLPAGTKEAFNRIYNSGDLLLGIINDILDLSKIEAGKFELMLANYDIASLIHDTVQLNMIRYESKPIGLKLEINENIPSAMIGDELRIKQILNNLLSNAFKYTQEGLVTLSVNSKAGSGSDMTLIFCVSDTGQGMTAEQVGKLGSEYSRFNADINRATEGTGLGMNITQNLVHLMNGKLVVESVPGMGSTFTVSLPQKNSGSGVLGKELAENLGRFNLESVSQINKTQIMREFMPYGRVLIVDDVETNLYVAKGLLSPYGLSIDTALSGFEAIEKIKDNCEYDIIFMDHMMPRMDGIEATKIIRNLGYNHPVVALTANALAGQAQFFLNNGFDGYISKPIDIRQLNSSLNKMIRDKQPQEVIDKAREQKNNIFSVVEEQQAAANPHLSELFIRDAEKAAAVMEAIHRNKCRRADDIPMFIINVHAMKSALANIGEPALSEEALKLEQAGRDRNIDLVMSEIPVFLASLREVIEKIRPEDKDGETMNETSAEVRKYLREKLLIIQAACARYNKKVAKETLAELREKKWTENTKKKLDSISEHLLHSEFEEAARTTQEIMPPS